MVLAMEASEEWGGSGGWDPTLTAQALQSLCIESSSYSSTFSLAVSAGAIRAFGAFIWMSTGPSEVQKVISDTDVVAEGRSGFKIREAEPACVT